VFGALLFGGAYLKRRDSVWFPISLLATSDVVLTTQIYHMKMGWTQGIDWLGFLAVTLIGGWLRKSQSVRKIAIAAVAGPTVFFLMSNFGVWLGGHGAHLYPHTWQGLVACYIGASPFYRNSLLSTAVYTALLFGFDEIYRRRRADAGHVVHAS